MKGLCLISGGFDSAVAASFLLDKNIDIIGIHFSIEPFTDSSPEEKSLEVCKILGVKKLFVVNAGELFAEITRNCNHELYFVISKRLMYRIASEIAKKESCDFIVTGESLGQVSSQTLKNLSTLSTATDLKVIRPLLAWDKDMITAFARNKNLFDVCSGPEVCDQLGPKHPSTNAPVNVVSFQESKLDVSKLVLEGVSNAKSISVC